MTAPANQRFLHGFYTIMTCFGSSDFGFWHYSRQIETNIGWKTSGLNGRQKNNIVSQVNRDPVNDQKYKVREKS